MNFRKFCVLLLTILIIAGFTGCKGNGNTNGQQGGDITSFSDLSGKKVGVITGNVSAMLVPRLIPEAICIEFNTIADAKMALENGKVDAFPSDESCYKSMLWEGIDVVRLEQPLAESEYGFIFSKGKNTELRNEMNEYIAKIKADGTHRALENKWFGLTEPKEFLSYDNLSGENGTLSIGISSLTKPFTYIKNGKYTGFDIELIIGFCQEYGYNVEFEDTLFSSVLSGVSSGNYHMGAAGFTITEERAENMDFSDCYHTEDIVVMVKDNNNLGKSFEDYKYAKVGVLEGGYFSTRAHEVFPNGQIVNFKTVPDCILALEIGKIDILPSDESVYTCVLWEGRCLDRLDEVHESSNCGIVFPKNGNIQLRNEMNELIRELGESGELQALDDKWFGPKEPTEFLSYDDLEGPNGTITVGLYTDGKPFTYMKNGKYVGFDVELVIKFAEKYGYALQFENAPFSSILGGVSTGKFDLAVSGFTITEERQESVDFSDVYHKEDIIYIIRDENVENNLIQFNSGKIGVISGSVFEDYAKERFPNATILGFKDHENLLKVLEKGNVSGIMFDEAYFTLVSGKNSRFQGIEVPEYSLQLGFGFNKNETGNLLMSQMNSFLAELQGNGTLKDLTDKWCSGTEPKGNIPLEELASNETVIKVAVDTAKKPFAYMNEEKPAGLEIEILYLFCEKYGYNIDIIPVSFATDFEKLNDTEYQIACGGLYITDEENENVNFSDPYMESKTVMVKYKKSGFENFIDSIKESFNKTFIRENRWRLIIEGVGTTMTISLFSVICGTTFGFALYMLSRSSKKQISMIVRGFAKVYSVIIAGTPIIVILMILFYIVFTSPDMSGVIVAIAGFTLTFGSFVYDRLDLSVSGVDNGQLEAAYALGFSKNRAFFKIILPQAMRMFIPSYSGEIISLIKQTSVVGYIAVNDITKVGDIIRGNTYEAFFPLIAVAIIYFVITWGIAVLLGMIRKRTEPKKRKNKNILKGVVR